MNNFTYEQTTVILDALEMYVAKLELQRLHLRLNQYGSKQELLDRIDVANDLIISLPAPDKYADYTPAELRAEIEAAKQCRDIDAALYNKGAAERAQAAIDEMEARLVEVVTDC